MTSERLRLSENLDPPIEEGFLALELQASAPYNRFVYDQPPLISQVQRALFDAHSGEFAPPHGRAALLGNSLVGMAAGLMSAELTRARINASVTLTRSGLLRDQALKRRVRLASQTLMRPNENDYYLSRIAVVATERTRLHAGRTLGVSLLDILEQDARARGASRFVADVSAELPRLLAFYQRLGFHELGQADVTDPNTGRRLCYAHLAKALN